MGLLTKILNNRERPLFIDNGQSIIAAADLRSFKIAKVAFANGAADAFAFAWQNPESNKILVTRVVLDVTTAATLAATLSIGSAADATTESTNLMLKAPINAIAVIDNLIVATVGGGAAIKVDENGGTTAYVTGRIKDQASATTVANIYIEYIEI
jgi:hypothetical protein